MTINYAAGGGRTHTPLRELDFESSASANSATAASNVAKQTDNHKVVTGFEPVMKVLQTSALPLGYTTMLLAIRKSIN